MKKPARLVSLDAFRGLTMAGMVIVNNPGDWGHVYPPLLHATWNGCTPTDLIFPFFLFIVGVSITLSTGHDGRSWRSCKRAIVIFGLGHAPGALSDAGISAIVRIPGVLQRIAVCYLAAAFLFRWTAPAHGSDDSAAVGRTAGRCCCGPSALTLGYWGVMMLVPVPGGVAGDLTPDGNLGAYIDRAVFGAHLWVQSKTWDPEGLLSTVPAHRDHAARRRGRALARVARLRRPEGPLDDSGPAVLAIGIGLVWSLVVSAEQGAVDEFLRLVHGRRGGRVPGVVLRAHRL